MTNAMKAKLGPDNEDLFSETYETFARRMIAAKDTVRFRIEMNILTSH